MSDDLVQRLRAAGNPSTTLCHEAADRIEELERGTRDAISVMGEVLKARQERIEALEEQNETWIKASVAHCKRIHDLEAALREIKLTSNGDTYEIRLIARRALEGKP